MVQPANLEKQIKRHVIGPRHEFFAVTAPGAQPWCARELTGLSDTIAVEAVDDAGVAFSGRLTDLYLAHLHLATAGRLLMRLARFKATNFRQLEKRVESIAWARYLPWGALPVCRAVAHQSRLYHTRAVADHCTRAIETYWQAQGAHPSHDGNQTLYLRLADDMATLSVDATGPNLYRRGLKTHGGEAPLRETTAAVVLRMAAYDPAGPLLDPMCGAGTFSLEAALMAKQIAPGALREFAFMQWPSFLARRWDYLKRSAIEAVRRLPTPSIHASDVDGEACQRLRDCIQQHHLDDAVTVQQGDFFSLKPPSQRQEGKKCGLIVLNPPYGRRLSAGESLASFYRRIGTKLQNDFKGWRAALIIPQPSLVQGLSLQLEAHPLHHGGLQLSLLLGEIR